MVGELVGDNDGVEVLGDEVGVDVVGDCVGDNDGVEVLGE